MIKVNPIDTSGFVLKTPYDTDKSVQEKKINDANKNIPDIIGLVKKTNYNTKISEIEGKIPSIAGLATTFAFTATENKISSVSNLVKKTDYDPKITGIESKYFSTSDYNKILV